MNLMVASANAAGDRWASWMVGASLDAALLFAVIGLVWLAIRRRVAPQVGYGLFLLVPLKLLVPVVVTLPVGLAQWTPSALASSWFEAPRAAERIERRPPAVIGPLATAKRHAIAWSEPRVEPRAKTKPVVVDSPRPAVPADLAPAPAVAKTPRLSVLAMAMIAWLGVAMLLLGRLIGEQFRFRARLQAASDLDGSSLGIDLGDLCRRAGLAGTVRVVEHDSTAAPAVWGVIRPTIILPRGISSALTAEQLRWVLLHELAHVGRMDLAVVAVERVAAILHFFNPAIWVANRIIDQLREYACDDLALSWSDSSAVASGEAFVRVLRHASGRRGFDGALGFFGLDSRAACLLRVRRLLDTDRRIPSAPGKWSLGGLMLLAVLSVPQLRAASDPAPAAVQEPAAQPNADGKAAAEAGQDFELLVIGPDGKPVPEAPVELSATPTMTAEQVRRGKFVKKTRFGATLTTDAEGRLQVTRPRASTDLDLYITMPGYGPYWASWRSDRHDGPVPPRFTAELEAGWSVGGVFVDNAGKPAAGVTVSPSIEFKKRPGLEQQLGSGARVQSDAAGRWRFDSVPVSMSEVHVEVNPPDFMPVRRTLPRSEFGIERGKEPATRLVLNRGLTMTGKVTDEAGKPIAGALIRTKFWNSLRETTTGIDGTYRLAGCEPRMARIVVSARGHATDMKELLVEPGMEPVDFSMKPGGTVRIRVVDEQDRPIPKARIFFQRWRGPFQYFEFNHVSQYADANGVWVWHEAPLDEFQADICSVGGGMDLSYQPLQARAEEYLFRLPGPLVVSGKVVDAETRAPIKAFRVVPGSRWSNLSMHWDRGESFPVTDGRYELSRTRSELAHVVRIEADGYRAAVSRDIKSTEGKVTIDFALSKGMNVVAKVMTPGVVPAAGAKIALGVAGSQIMIKNGDIDDRSTFAARATTDSAGRFQFPAQDADFQLVITHPEGFARLKSAPEWDTVQIIRLEPWARVEGTFRIGPAPAADVPITIRVASLDSFGDGAPSIFSDFETKTGPGGRFVFDRVVPGRGQIGRRIMWMVNDGATEVTSSSMVGAEFVGGKTIQIDLGGTGRPVVGKLQPPEGATERVLWNFAEVRVQRSALDAQVVGPYISASVDRDGTFRIDDVPAGDYSLSVEFHTRPSPGRVTSHRFAVPPLDDKNAFKPVDLGTLTLQK